jgi:hypothetical protein
MEVFENMKVSEERTIDPSSSLLDELYQRVRRICDCFSVRKVM